MYRQNMFLWPVDNLVYAELVTFVVQYVRS
jgi:hypothetical protein